MNEQFVQQHNGDGEEHAVDINIHAVRKASTFRMVWKDI